MIGCLFAVVLVKAQSPNFAWAKKMGGPALDKGSSIAVDPSGNVYTTGIFAGTADFDPGIGILNLTPVGAFDIFISKLDASGGLVWVKQLGGNSFDFGNSIAVDASGNVYTTGSFDGTVDFDPNAGIFNLTGVSDIFVSKLDASGNFVWAKNMGGDFADQGNAIAVDASGNVYTAGTFDTSGDFDPGAGTFILSSAGSGEVFVSKLDASGNFIWAKSVSASIGNALSLDARGNVYVTGSSPDFITKLDPSGNLIWQKNLIGNVGGSSISVDASGHVYATGYFSLTVDFDPGPGSFNLTAPGAMQAFDIFVSKSDSLGNFLWAKGFGGQGPDVGNAIALDASANIYSTGEFRDTVDFDPGPGTLDLISVPNDLTNMFILKLDSSGNFLWAKSFGGAATGFGIVVNSSDNVYTTGNFSSTVDFNPGPETFSLTSVGASYDIFVSKLGDTITGINYADTNNVFVYPNPTNGLVNVVVAKPSDNVWIEIFNSLGILVYKQLKVNELNTIELGNLANGLYFVKSINSNKMIATQKIVKQSHLTND